MLYDGLALPASGLSVLDGGHVFQKKKKKSAACCARWAGFGMVRMCVRSVRGLLDWRRDRQRMMSVGRAGRCGLHGLCLPPRGRRLDVLRGLACSCSAGIGQGSLLPGAGLACRPLSMGYEGCLGPSAGQMVGGGFCVC